MQEVHDLTGLKCPQLFVQFKFRLRQLKSEQVSYHFSPDAHLNDVFNYLDKYAYRYEWNNPCLTVFNNKERPHA